MHVYDTMVILSYYYGCILWVILVTLVIIVPISRGVSNHAPLLLCPEGIMPRGGSNGHFNHVDPWSASLSLYIVVLDSLLDSLHWAYRHFHQWHMDPLIKSLTRDCFNCVLQHLQSGLVSWVVGGGEVLANNGSIKIMVSR